MLKRSLVSKDLPPFSILSGFGKKNRSLNDFLVKSILRLNVLFPCLEQLALIQTNYFRFCSYLKMIAILHLTEAVQTQIEMMVVIARQCSSSKLKKNTSFSTIASKNQIALKEQDAEIREILELQNNIKNLPIKEETKPFMEIVKEVALTETFNKLMLEVRQYKALGISVINSELNKNIDIKNKSFYAYLTKLSNIIKKCIQEEEKTSFVSLEKLREFIKEEAIDMRIEEIG